MNNNFFEEVYNNPYHISRNNKSQLYVDNYNKYYKNNNNDALKNRKRNLSNIFINNGNYLSNSYDRIYNVFKNNYNNTENNNENDNLSKSVVLNKNNSLNQKIKNNNFSLSKNNDYTIKENNINYTENIPQIKQYYNPNNYNINNNNNNQNLLNNYYSNINSRNRFIKNPIKNIKKNYYNTSEYLYEYVRYNPENYVPNNTRNYKRSDTQTTIERDLDKYTYPVHPFDKNFGDKYFNYLYSLNKYRKNEEDERSVNNSNDNNNSNIYKNPTLRNSIANKNTLKSSLGEEQFFGIIKGQGENAVHPNDVFDAYIDGDKPEIQTNVKIK